MKLSSKLHYIRVIGVPVTSLEFDAQINLITDWAKTRESRSVCVANVHMIVEARRNPGFAAVLEKADLVTPDGMPLVWMLRWLGYPQQDRVAGLDIMLALCSRATRENLSFFFLGSEGCVLERMHRRFQEEFPDLKIAGMLELPFRPLTPAEDEEIVEIVNDSGAKILLVSLGCPKQETWIAKQQNRIQAVMIGLGGVFPVYAGYKKRAPYFIREAGLEWLYRLVQEPHRLWQRYSTTIPIFLWLALQQLLDSKVRRSDAD